MSIQLQIAIPLFVTLAGLAGIAIWRKYFKPEVLVIGLVVLSLGVGMTWSHVDSQSIWDETDADTISNTNAVSLMMARQFMLMDQTDAAMDILDELTQVSGDNQQIRLTMARGAMLQNNYAAAVQLYNQSADAPKKELTHARQLLASTQSGDASFLSFLGNRGANPKDYGLDAGKLKLGDREAAQTLVLKAIKEELEADQDAYGSEWVDAAEAAAQITAGFKAYVEGTGETEAVQEAMKTLVGCISDAPGLEQNVHIRLARLRGYILAGDYQKVAACADENVSTQELIVLAELYVKGLVTDADFSRDYMGLGAAGVRKILSLCTDVLDSREDQLTDREAERYQQKLDELEQSLDTPGRFTMQQGLLDSASAGDPALSSKSYLALAKLEDHAGNEEKAANYIGQAIGTAGDSDDDSYRNAMNQVSQIVQGTTDADEIKNVATYVDQALEHSLEAQVPPSMLTQKEQTENPAPDEEKESFADSMTQTINESTATLNIGSINKDDFPEIKARVQIQSTKWDTIEELEKNLQVYDCGSAITDFTLEQMEFERSRIILLCDISGSMSGNVEQLKQAIIAFAEQMQEGEEVCVIGFDDDIVFIHEFSGDKEEVKGFAESIKIAGGTAVYKSLLKAGEVIPYDPASNNVIIAMTDGQDGSPAKEGDMRNHIGALAADKDVTIYTVGLGSSVDLDYLAMMAKYGNGSSLYAKSIDELSDFYDFIHGQLRNQYILSYKAKNLTKNQRLLELRLADEIGKASKTYYKEDPDYTDEDTSSYNPYTVEDTDVVIYGFTAKSVYKSTKDQTLTLRGEGFDSGDDITVRITGNEEYVLKAEFKDSKTYTVTLPKEVSVGTYDLSVSLQGESVKLEDELTVGSQLGQKTFRYGGYIFTAQSVSTNGDTTVLSGNVMMGSWLHFKGDVTIQGKTTDERIRVTDNSGCYISYSTSTAQGLAKTVADLGISISLGKLGTFQLYGDPYTPGERENFRTQGIDVLWQLNLKCFKVENLQIAVYPDALEIRVPKMEFELPLQKQVLRDLSVAKSCKLENELDLQLTSTRIAMKDTAKYTAEKAKETDFVMVSLPLRLYEAELVIDTLKQEYSLSAEVRLKALAAGADPTDENYFKLDFGVKDGKFDSIGFQTDAAEITLVAQPVPVEMGDFGFSLGNFSKYDSDDSALSNLLSTEIKFKFSVSVASLEAYLPGIEEILDKKDIALATLDDCELSLQLKEFRIAFDAKVKLCGALEIGKCRVVLGKFDYTNALIGYYNETEYGLQIAVTVGSTWKTTNLSLQLTGTGELTLGYPYSGLWYDGDVDFEVGWWLLRADFAVSGDILIGAYKNSMDQLQFSVIVKGTNNKGESAGFHVYFTKSTGLGMYEY